MKFEVAAQEGGCMRKAVLFDQFASVCQFFNRETEVNNGYGCNHPEQEMTDEDENGQEQGLCDCHSCPLGVEAEQVDVASTEVDWDGLCEDGEVAESEYLLIICGDDASDDEKIALNNYEAYMNRYNYLAAAGK